MLGKIEKIAYKLVKENPALKDFLKKIYQKTLITFSNKKTVINKRITVNKGHFYGFHDRSPWNIANTKILTHKYVFDDKLADKNDKIEIGFFEGANFDKYVKVTETNSWNLQQGSMLTWAGENIVFNDWNGENNIAKLVSLKNEIIKEFSTTIGIVSEDGTKAIAYDFDRIGEGMPGYGYGNIGSVNIKENLPKDYYLYFIDMKTFKEKKLISIEEISKFKSKDSMKSAYHIFTHAQFSPNNKRFLFLHRWSKKGKRPNTRMFSCNIDGTGLHLFPTTGMVSHITWYGNNKIIGFSETKDGDGFYIFEDETENYKLVDEKNYNVDGHPQYCNSNSLIVNDSYPDKFRFQELSIFDVKKNEKTILAKLFSPIKFMGLIRCDLHPRWDRNGGMICFDSTHTGIRSQCIMFLNS